MRPKNNQAQFQTLIRSLISGSGSSGSGSGSGVDAATVLSMLTSGNFVSVKDDDNNAGHKIIDLAVYAKTETDANQCMRTGYYKLESTAEHLPNNKTTFIVTIAWKSTNGSTIERFQIGIDYKTSYANGGPTLWSRTYTNSAWRDWRPMTWASGTNDVTLNEKIADLESRLAALEGGNA